MGKISQRLFNKLVNNKELVLTRDDFISNGYWAIRKDILDNALNQINYKISREGVTSIVALMTQDFMLGLSFLDEILTRTEKELSYYDNIKFKEQEKNGIQYLVIDNINELRNYAIDKFYYNTIQKIVGKKVKPRILRVDHVFYYRKDKWNGEIKKVDKNTFIFFVWIEKNCDDLSKLLAVCMPCKLE
jgi:hypothetical protein